MKTYPEQSKVISRTRIKKMFIIDWNSTQSKRLGVRGGLEGEGWGWKRGRGPGEEKQLIQRIFWNLFKFFVLHLAGSRNSQS